MTEFPKRNCRNRGHETLISFCLSMNQPFVFSTPLAEPLILKNSLVISPWTLVISL
jgi:hypothetical protein